MDVLEDWRPAPSSDRGISVRDWLDSAGAPWQRLLGYFASGTGKDGRGNTCTRAGDLSSGLFVGRARIYRSVGRRREDSRRDGARFEMSLCSAGRDAARGWDGALEEIDSASATAFQGAVEGLWRCSALFSDSVLENNGEAVAVADIHGHPHPMPSRRLGETALVQYQQ
jgi:hypothetical protein